MDVVRKVFAILVAHEGNVTRAHEHIVDNPVLDSEGRPHVPAYGTICKWRTDTYSETWLDMERRHAEEIEDEIIRMQRARVHRASEIELDMMEKVAREANGRDLPFALRAIADVKSKSLDGLLKMTGRAQQTSGGTSFEQLIRDMSGKGYLKLSVSLDTEKAPEPPPSAQIVEGTAETEQ